MGDAKMSKKRKSDVTIDSNVKSKKRKLQKSEEAEPANERIRKRDRAERDKDTMVATSITVDLDTLDSNDLSISYHTDKLDTTRGASKAATTPSNTDYVDTADSDDQDPGSLKRFAICKDTRRILRGMGIKSLFEIQIQTFQCIYDKKDVLARSKTGSGKTLAFSLPLIERMLSAGELTQVPRRGAKVLCLLPTRELAQQVAGDFSALRSNPPRFNTVCVYGGVPEYTQTAALREGVDFIIGTPGRVFDLLSRRLMNVESMGVVILDEADQMLQMGFKESVDEILGLIYTSIEEGGASRSRLQFLLFSATLPPWVQALSREYMSKDKVVVDLISNLKVADSGQTAEGIKHYVISCPFSERAGVLERIIPMYTSPLTGRAIVFVDKKSVASEIAMNSSMSHFCQVLHGDIKQDQREITLKAFREGRFRCLVATDVAARGVHIEGVELVVQMTIPKDNETYVHRSGRTGRAGRSGVCIVFCSPREQHTLSQLMHKIGVTFERRGIPQPPSILASAAKHSVQSMLDTKNARESTLNPFMREAKDLLKEPAERLMEECGNPTEAISRCLMQLANYRMISTFPDKSAVTGRDGVRAYIVRSQKYFGAGGRGASVRYLLSKYLKVSSEVAGRVSAVCPLKDKSGVCFDLASTVCEELDAVVAAEKNAEINVERVTNLPDIQDNVFNVTASNGRGGYSSSEGYSSRGSASARRGGYAGGFRQNSQNGKSSSYDRGSSRGRGGRGGFGGRSW
eukprot:Lankesteria_metandrocarpae@DN4057_c0_g1_i1.p1